MTSQDFEAEIKKIDPGFSVVENPNRPGLSNIFYNGKNYDLSVISTHNIPAEPDPTYRYEFGGGINPRHHSQQEVKDRLTQFLVDLKAGLYDQE